MMLNQSPPVAQTNAPENGAVPRQNTGAHNLGARTARGFVWMMLQTIAAKFVGLGSQIVLALLLMPEDFGLISLAYTITSITGLLQSAGLGELMVQRHAHYRRWVNPAFWIAFARGSIGFLLMLIIAPLAAWGYKEPRLLGLSLILAAGCPMNAVASIFSARLRGDLRFRTLAVLGLAQNILLPSLSVGFAWWGYGAYSFAFPRLIMSLVMLAILWQLARPPLRWNLQFRRWRFLLGDSAMLFAVSLTIMAIMQGDYIALGLMHDARTVGIYYFAFNLSTQTIALLSGPFGDVLLPAFSKLQQEPQRQKEAFLRAVRLLAIVGLPVCLAQAVLSDPLIRIAFDVRKWEASIPVLQILSVGMAIRLVTGPSHGMIQSQGRFKTYLLLTTLYALAFIGSVMIGSWLGGAVSVAVAGTACLLVFEPMLMLTAIQPAGGRALDILFVYGSPLLASTVSLGTGWLAACFLWPDHQHNLARVGLVAILSITIYIPLIRLLAPQDVRDLISRLRRVVAPAGL